MSDPPVSRREALRTGLATVSAFALGPSLRAEPGRLATRHRAPKSTTAPGTHNLTVDGSPDALLIVPSRYRPEHAAPLLVVLHGATGTAEGISRRFTAKCEELGVVMLAPKSEGGTWDAIRGTFSADAAAIDTQLAQVFDRVRVDPGQVNVAGFSDGASYALSLGLVNGDFFRHVLAFSPGFIIPGKSRGRPPVYISHGRSDPVLPIEMCGRRIAAQLRADRYPVRFDEFDGGHTVPPDIQEKSFGWMLSK